jgi:hypothetical protein
MALSSYSISLVKFIKAYRPFHHGSRGSECPYHHRPLPRRLSLPRLTLQASRPPFRNLPSLSNHLREEDHVTHSHMKNTLQNVQFNIPLIRLLLELLELTGGVSVSSALNSPPLSNSTLCRALLNYHLGGD